MNKKGFALTETLVVVVFLVTIFTFIYVSIVPLIGKYESAIEKEEDIDIIYKLYHVRKVLMSDNYRNTLANEEVKNIRCDNLTTQNKTFCNQLMEQMELKTSTTEYYILVYAKSLSDANIDSIKGINGEIGEYASKYKSRISGKVLFLLDTRKHTIAYLNYDDAV